MVAPRPRALTTERPPHCWPAVASKPVTVTMSASADADRGPSPRSGSRPGVGRNTGVVDLLNVNEVAAALRVSKMTVYRLVRDKRLPAIRLGSSLRVYRHDLDAFLSAAFQPSPPADLGQEPGAEMSNPPGI